MNKCKFCQREIKSESGLKCHLKRVHNYDWLNDILRKKCKNPECNETLREDDRHFYHNHSCQISHQQKLRWEKYRTDAKFRDEYNKKIRNKHKQKYGVEYNFQRTDIIEKSKQTKLKKYGNENYVNPDKIKKTKLKKYGSENAFGWQSKEMKKILKDKYNNEYYSNNKVAMKTYLERHGGIGFQLEKNINKSIETKRKKSNEKFNLYLKTAKLEQIADNKFKCLECNFVFSKKNIIQTAKYPICFKCHPTIGTSKFEKEIINFIKSMYLDDNIYQRYKFIKNKDNKNIEVDIFLEKRKIAIEANGNYYHSELNGKDKTFHVNKTNVCNHNNIRLIHIFEDEWFLKNNIVKSILKSMFGVNNEKLYARKCIIKEIDSNTKNKFLNEYHLQGEDKSSIKLGAFYNNELVAVMTFSKYRIAMSTCSKENEYELSRFAFSKRVIGIAGKLLKYFINNYKPKKIITYADKRYFTGEVYEKIGFKKVSETPPNYWYIKTNNYMNRLYRFNYRKSLLKEKLNNFDSNLTEWQNMQLNGYDRIWDCGHLKFEINL